MKRKRYLPFGYGMQNGKLVIDPVEAKLVAGIYEEYSQGASLQKLVKWAQASGVKYRENADKWNKAMIARILDCTWYVGSDEAPDLVSAELFCQVKEMRKNKAEVYGGALETEMRAVRRCLCCRRCGHALERVNHKNANYIRWKCNTCHTETDYIPDIVLLETVKRLIQYLIKNPEIAVRGQEEHKISLRAHKLENEIRRDMHNPMIADETLLNMICEWAEEKYKECATGREEVQTRYIQSVLASAKDDGQADFPTFRQIIDSVLIAAEGQISIRLSNGVIVERGTPR